MLAIGIQHVQGSNGKENTSFTSTTGVGPGPVVPCQDCNGARLDETAVMWTAVL